MAVFSQEELQLLRNLPEVVEGRRRLAKTPVVSMTVTLPEPIRETLQKYWGIKLKNAPLRWIRGDTLPHEDRGAYAFTDTYLVYLTDGNGKLTIGNDTHAMKSGCGFKFSEGTRHCVTHTNGTSRLMLGPMTSRGMYVGSDNLIFANPGETVYLDQYDNGTPTMPPPLVMRYKKGITGDWIELTPEVPIMLINNNPAGGIIRVLFSSDITVLSPNLRLIIGSEKIQIGDSSVNPNGKRPLISVDGVTGYLGFINNSSNGFDGYNDISVYNLRVRATNGATINAGSGWVGSGGFGQNSLNNSFLCCSSDGPIPESGGGIVGAQFATGTSSALIVGCTSSGSIGLGAGGIVGSGAGETGGTVVIRNCWSTGGMESYAGGIVGAQGGGGGSCTVEKCYSTGTGGAATGCGGIFGANAGSTTGIAIARYCYSTGDVVQGGGGIFGIDPADGGGNITATQCYSTGTVDTLNGGGGIVASYNNPSPQGTVTVTDCYTSGATAAPTGYIIAGDPTEGPSGSNYSEAYHGGTGWNSENAYATIGVVAFIPVYVDQPFVLQPFGPSPYTLQTIAPSGTDITLSYSQTLVEGSQSGPALVGGGNSPEYRILNEESITIDPVTGRITAPAYNPTKPTFTLVIFARNLAGEYSVTNFILTVTSSGPPTPTSTTVFALGGKGFDLDTYTDLLGGRLLVLERIPNPNLRFEAFDDYHRYRKAWALNHN